MLTTTDQTIAFIPATADTIKALSDHSIFIGLGWSDILAIFALVISTGTSISLFFAQRNLSNQSEAEAERRASDREKSDRIRRALISALDFHREYNSEDMSKARAGAIKFVKANRDIDWVQEPELSKFDTPETHADDLFKIMRFFHRLNVFRQLEEVDISTTSKLLGNELAWWYGFAFETMENRSYSRTMRDIIELTAATKVENERWDIDLRRGQHARLTTA